MSAVSRIPNKNPVVRGGDEQGNSVGKKRAPAKSLGVRNGGVAKQTPVRARQQQPQAKRVVSKVLIFVERLSKQLSSFQFTSDEESCDRK